MTVDKALAVVLFVEPSKSSVDVAFACTLSNAALEGVPETGERLDCQTWADGSWILSIGTEDYEALSARQPEAGVSEDPYPITYSTSTIRFDLTNAPAGTRRSFHFILAYKGLPDERECSTWFAVDVRHAEARSAVGDLGRQ